MKKFAVYMVIVLLITLLGCAPGPASDSGINPFIGSWELYYGEKLNFKYEFSGKQFSIAEPDGKTLSGTYIFTKNRITFITEDAMWDQKYQLMDSARISLACIA